MVNALQEQNVEVAAGQVGQPPIKAGQQFQISVRAIGRLTEPSQFENIILKANADGTLVRLKDVGRAELGAEDYSSDLRLNGHDAVGLASRSSPPPMRSTLIAGRWRNWIGSRNTSRRE